MDAVSPSEEDRRSAARCWVLRVREPLFADWQGLTEWLEADPANTRAYDAAADADDTMAELLSMPSALTTVPERPERSRRRFLIKGGAIAASVALVAAFAATYRDADTVTTVFATKAGERRTVELAAGDSVMLNGDTRLLIDSGTPRQAVLDRGQAVFSIRHDAARPFVLLAGRHRLVDAGTRFEVTRDGSTLAVAVSEGEVIYEPSGPAHRLGIGSALRTDDASGRAVMSRIAPAAVGSWQNGVLVYVDASMDQVATDLSRNLGARVRLSGTVQRFDRFTGTLAIGGAPDAVLARLAPLLGVSVRRDGDGWLLAPPRG